MTDQTPFDPSTVPPFPVYTLRLDDDGVVELDGVPIEPPAGGSPTEAGVTAAAAKAAAAGLDAVHVRAHFGNRQRDMVITAAGASYDVTVDEAPPKRRLGLIIGGAALTAALAAGGVITGLTLAETPEPTASPTLTPPPGQGAEVPAALPAGYRPHAVWAVPVADRSTAVPLRADQVLTVTPDRELHIRDAEGTLIWSGTSAPIDVAEVHETTWTGRDVLAAAPGQSLQLWARDLDAAVSNPVTIDLDARAEVTYAGTAPLIDLGDFTVAVPRPEGGLTRLSLPVGTRPAVATAEAVVSVGDGMIATVPVDGTDPTTRNFELPAGAKGSPAQVIGLDSEHALALWPAEDGRTSTTAVINLTSAVTTHTQTLPTSGLNLHDTPPHDPAAGTIVLDRYFLAYRDDSPIVDVSDVDVSAIAGRTLYGIHAQQPATAHVNHDRLIINSYTAVTDDPLPLSAATADAGYITIPRVDQTILYRLSKETS